MTTTPDPDFTPPPEEPRWGGTGPSDRNAEPLGEAEQAEEDAANADA
jgi:hypothetical protein